MTVQVKIITIKTGAIIDTFVEVLTFDTRVDVMIVVSNVTVDLLMNVLTVIISDIVTNIAVGVLVGVNVNVFVSVITAFAFARSDPFEEFRCSAAFDCRPMAALSSSSVLQA